MKAKRLFPQWWILTSLLFSIHTFAQYPTGQEPSVTHYIVGYEYFFNHDEGLTYTPVTPTTNENLNISIDITSLTTEINMLHIRFKDDNGFWSPMQSKLFLIPNNPIVNNPDKSIIGYEYSFNNFEGLQYVAVTPTNNEDLSVVIDISSLSKEINMIHFRFKDDSGMWSPMQSKLFLKPNNPTINNPDKSIIGYEYSFNNFEGLQYVPITPTNDADLNIALDISSLSKEINMIHFRFKDDSGMWSPMQSKLFLVPNSPIVNEPDKNIIGYEYSFNDFEGLQYVAVSPTNNEDLNVTIDISNLSKEINMIHFRFKDDSGMWSPMQSKLFLKPTIPPTDILSNNNLVAYEYWFDDNQTGFRTIPINPNIHDITLIELDVSHIWRGQHILHTRFKDANNTYSVTSSDTIRKVSYPLAKFTTSTTEICIGNAIQFNNNGSVDYDTYVWDFGDGATSNNLDETHTYTTNGTFTVSLTVTDTNTNTSNTMQQEITVSNYPSNTVNITGNNPSCFGETVTLSADASNMNYLWSTGETTQSIVVNTNGNYSVQVSNPSGAQCSVQSTDYTISFYPQIDNSITVNTAPVELIANQANATYQWIDCNNNNTAIAGETNQNFTPMQSGNYAVEISMNGCIETSNCENVSVVSITKNDLENIVHIYPNPVKDRLYITSSEPIKISVYDTSGRIYNTLYYNNKLFIDVSNYSKGIYFINITTTNSNKRSHTYKIIKK